MKKTFYEKVGRRYKPVYEYDSELLDSYSKGSHLIVCHPGETIRKYDINPAYAPLIAAGIVAIDDMTRAIQNASEIKLKRRDGFPLTPEQHDAWQNLIDKLGDDARVLNWNSSRQIAETGIKALQEYAEKIMTVPAVKKAYDHFLLVCELTKDEIKG